jgi:hypothetical protein
MRLVEMRNLSVEIELDAGNGGGVSIKHGGVVKINQNSLDDLWNIFMVSGMG